MAELQPTERPPSLDAWIGVGLAGIFAALLAGGLTQTLWAPAAGHDVGWPEKGLRLLFALLVWAVLTWLFVRTGR